MFGAPFGGLGRIAVKQRSPPALETNVFRGSSEESLQGYALKAKESSASPCL